MKLLQRKLFAYLSRGNVLSFTPLSLLFNCHTRVFLSPIGVSFFPSLESIHLYLIKLSPTDENSFTHTDHARVYYLQTPCAEGELPVTLKVVRASSDRTSDRRLVDAGLDQRLANPGEYPNKFHEMMHPLLTIWIGRCPDGKAHRSGGCNIVFCSFVTWMLSLLQGVTYFQYQPQQNNLCFLFRISITTKDRIIKSIYKKKVVVTLKLKFFW